MRNLEHSTRVGIVVLSLLVIVTGRPTLVGMPQIQSARGFELSRSKDMAVADGTKYACSGRGIRAALDSLPRSGGIVDARGCQGTMTWNAGLTVGAEGTPETLYLGDVVIRTGGPIRIEGSSSHVYGISRETVFLQDPSFPRNTPVLQIGATLWVAQSSFDGVSVNCGNGRNSIGAKNAGGQELSGFFDFVSQNCTKYGVWYEGVGVQNSSGAHWVIETSGGSPSTVGAYIHAAPIRGVSDATFNTNDSSTIGKQLVVDGSIGDYHGIHVEHGAIGIDVGPTLPNAGPIFSTVTGGSDMPTLIAIENTTGNRATFDSIQSNGSPITLADEVDGVTIRNTYVPRYTIGDSGQTPFYFLNNSIVAGGYATASNCNSNTTPARCGSAAAGSVAIPAGASSVEVNTTAVTPDSEILLTFDSSLSKRLNIKCAAALDESYVSSRTAGTGFRITVSVRRKDSNCYSYQIIN